ncbi:hypothetical protein OEA41_008118 [Lepraria neglecta]|uniref:Uncharacterized protein n=1 Tax=Lepraria neglecta TaxID=209136 RepID=A0AAD9ZE30_9LECA|nr:hypothetical protein OEA41_008118 [Lepraria neglecta]
MEEGRGLFGFAKLKGPENFKTWWRNMQFALADALLLKYVDGTYPRPRPGPVPDGSSEAVKAESLRDQNSWDAQDGRASARLGYMCSQDVQQFLDIETSSSRTSAQTLEFLKEKFTPSGLAAKWAALSKLSSISYKGSITNMSTEFKTVWTEMTDLNVELKDVILLTLLNNLGPEWNQYRTVLKKKARKDNSITFDDAVKGLIYHEQGMKNEVSAHWTRTTPESNSNESCSCCGFKGHQKPSCT